MSFQSTSSHLYLYLQSGLFLSGFSTRILYAFSYTHTCHIPCLPHLYSVGHHNIIWHGVQTMNLLFIQISPVLFHLLSPSHRYFPQDSIHTQPQYDQPCFTPIYSNWQNYTYVYFNHHVFRYQIERQKILDQMAAKIPSI